MMVPKMSARNKNFVNFD